MFKGSEENLISSCWKLWNGEGRMRILGDESDSNQQEQEPPGRARVGREILNMLEGMTKLLNQENLGWTQGIGN